MSALTGRTIQDTYPFLLCVDHAGGLDTTVRPVQDGLGNASALGLSTNAATITGTLGVSGTLTASAFDGVGTALTALTPEQCVPDQTGHSGEFLTTNGTTVSWAAGGGGGISDGDKGDITVSGSGSVWTIDAATVTEAKMVLADNTTGNVSTAKHGFAPKAPNDATKFLDGTGAYSVPAGSGTVTAVSVSSANGFAGSSSGGATPALTLSTTITGLLKGDGTAISAASAGTDYQAADATLTAFAALTVAANSLTVGTGADAFSQTTFAANTFPARSSSGNLVAKTITDFALTVLDDADAATARTTLGAAALASPTFTGDPKAPTPSAGDNDTSIATTAYVQTELTAFSGGGGAGSAINLQGGYSSRPSAGTAGRVYKATDAPLTWRDNGSTWDLYEPVYRSNADKVTIGSWTASSIGTGTVTDVNGSIFIKAQTNGSDQLRYYKKNLAASSNYTITAVMVCSLPTTTFRQAFIGVRESSSSKLVTWTLSNAVSSFALHVRVELWTNDTTYSTDLGTSIGIADIGGRPIYMRIVDDGTNRTYSFSIDDVNYVTFASHLRGVFGTPDQIVFGTNCSSAGQEPCAAWLTIREA